MAAGLRTGPGTGVVLKRAVAFALLLLLTRLVCLAIIYDFSGHSEFTDDVTMHSEMARAPFAPFLGRTTDTSHPPFLNLLLGPTAGLLSLVMSEFLAMRLASILFETLAAFVFGMLAQQAYGLRLFWSPASAAFLIMPMGWMTSAVMAQDESIAALFVLAVAWLVSTRRHAAALLVCGLGVSAAKIFLLGPLAALVLLLPWSTLLRRALMAGVPAIVPYVWAWMASVAAGAPPPLLGFNPGVDCSVSLWVLLTTDGLVGREAARRISSVLVAGMLAAVLIPLRRRTGLRDHHVHLVMVSILLWILCLFFHVNPEYYVMALPLLLLAFPSRTSAALITTASVLPWVVNFTYGVRNALERGLLQGGKGRFVSLYQSLVPVSPATSFVAASLIWISVSLVLAIAATRRLHALR